MQSAGVTLLDSLADVRDTAENDKLRDVMTEVFRDVSEGRSFSEAMENHPRIFSKLYIALIRAGEDTGDLTLSYRQLIHYLKWLDDIQSKAKKATRYPMILLVAVIVVVVVMLGFVVPKIIGFMSNLEQGIPIYTQALINASWFFRTFWWAVIGFPIALWATIRTLKGLSDEFAYRIDLIILNLPMIGLLLRKINIARYTQTFAALYAAGIDVIRCLESARMTLTNNALSQAMESVQHHVQTGSTLSDAFNSSGEMPSMVVRMVSIGEESGDFTTVLGQVSEFYNKDVDDTVQAVISMIEPLLTVILGGLIAWIAIAVFGPIYSSFSGMNL